MTNEQYNTEINHDADMLIYRSTEYRMLNPAYIRDLTTFVTMHIRGYDRLKRQTIIQSATKNKHDKYDRLAIIDTRIAALRCLIRELGMSISPREWNDTITYQELCRVPVSVPSDDPIMPHPTAAHDGTH